MAFTKDIKTYIQMLSYARPEGSEAQALFCKRFLQPTFGRPDAHGNYIHTIGDKPNVCFTSHHDTVHRQGGEQKVAFDGASGLFKLPRKSTSTCLGADCTTGVWLMLEMIKRNVPGTYVVHAAEECGGLGSRALVGNNPDWIKHTDAVISFDRKGTGSIITEQSWEVTASDKFAASLAGVLDMDLAPDPHGSFTDSASYSDVVSECTNISVGYMNQHTQRETQSLPFMRKLRDQLCSADWSQLETFRDPTANDWYRPNYYQSRKRGRSARYFLDGYDEFTFGYDQGQSRRLNGGSFASYVEAYPEHAVALLEAYGATREDLIHVIDTYPNPRTIL